MFKRILVAVAASETGELALQTAIGLAAESQVQLRIVHAVETANVNMGAEFPASASARQPDLRPNQISSRSTPDSAYPPRPLPTMPKPGRPILSLSVRTGVTDSPACSSAASPKGAPAWRANLFCWFVEK